MSLMQKGEYSTLYRLEDSYWWYTSLRSVILQNLLPHLNSSTLVLDLGCGTGRNLKLLQKHKIPAVGLDLSPDAVLYARTRRVVVKKGSITNIPFPDNYFSAIVCCDVLGALDSTECTNAIEEIYRVLKPGGLLFLQVAAYQWLYSQHDIVTGFKHRFTKKDVSQILNDSLWKINKISYRYFLFFIPMATVKIIKRVFKLQTNHTDLKSLPPTINILLQLSMFIEDYCMKFINYPIGTSLMVFAQKK